MYQLCGAALSRLSTSVQMMAMPINTKNFLAGCLLLLFFDINPFSIDIGGLNITIIAHGHKRK